MDSSKRLWEESYASVANEVFWNRVRSGWVGLMSTSGLGGLIAVLTHFIAQGSWHFSALIGAIGVASFWLLVYLVLWAVVAPRMQRNAAKKRIDYLERKPIVELGHEAIKDGANSIYLIPATNHGPGNVKLYIQVTGITYSDGENKKSPIQPVEYLRWRSGSGNHLEGTPNWEPFTEGEIRYLHAMEFTGAEILSNGERGTTGRITAANVSNNYEFKATAGTEIQIDLQAFGDPNLASVTKQSVCIKIPKT